MTDLDVRPSPGAAAPPPLRPAPRLGFRGGLRFLWTQLTSMRTALALLFALLQRRRIERVRRMADADASADRDAGASQPAAT